MHVDNWPDSYRSFGRKPAAELAGNSCSSGLSLVDHKHKDAPRGSVTAFCAEHGISRKTFYALRARARNEGQAAVLELRSRRPKTSPTKISEDVKDQAVAVRKAMNASGWDHGPISVPNKMLTMG